MKNIFILCTLLLLQYSNSAIQLETLNLPPGFNISVISVIPRARQLAISQNGTLAVGSRRENVSIITGILNGRPRKKIIATGLNSPNGVAWHGSDLYVAEIDRMIVYRDLENRLNDDMEDLVPEEIATFPDKEHHGLKYIKINPYTNKMFVPIGAPCNICERPLPFGTIYYMNLDGSNRTLFAKGIRNTVGFDWDPKTRELWFTENGVDGWGNDHPPDELNHAPREGLHFGFPFCHGKNNPYKAVNPFNPCINCTRFVPAAYNLGPHVAALGMTFYKGDMFPREYKNLVVIAEHGSWDREVPVGYRIVTVDITPNVSEPYKVFIDGWLNDTTGKAWGRPVDVLNMPDGSLLISDDKTGAIYRVTYSNSSSSSEYITLDVASQGVTMNLLVMLVAVIISLLLAVRCSKLAL